jgi:hypothetical protein
MQAAGTSWVKKHINDRCFEGKDLNTALITPGDDYRGKAGLRQLANPGLQGNSTEDLFRGREGWELARIELEWNWCLSVMVSVLRLLLWHLLQPAMYAAVLYAYSDMIDETQLNLGKAVLAREATYVVLVLVGLRKRPAFLLVNLDSHGDKGVRLLQKAAYVLAPEKFLLSILAGAQGSCCAFIFLFPLDMCALGALFVGLANGDLQAPLAVGYVVTALSGIVIVIGCCRNPPPPFGAKPPPVAEQEQHSAKDAGPPCQIL